ncbi:MAG: MFS transporter [Ferruginibacter sp.]
MRIVLIKIAVFFAYFLFGVLLNSVGTAILQVQHYFGAAESEAAVLEMFKDVTIAVVSFTIASFIVRIGYKRSMLIGLFAVACTCFIIPSVKTMLSIKLLFAVTGASFALTKISVFATIGLVTRTEKEHLSLMSFIESCFMIGVLSGYFLFSFFIDNNNPASDHWLNVYYVIGALYSAAFILMLLAPLDENAARSGLHEKKGLENFADMFRLALLPFVVSFIVCAFLYVLVEQSIMSWLPTFNNKVLHIPSSFSVLLAGILSAATALGRFIAGFILKKFGWHIVLSVCLCAAAIMVLTVLPLSKTEGGAAIQSWKDIPLAAYIFPLIGFFLAPVYPAINSVVLASLAREKHAAMSGLIVLFSALGGSLGSIITGYIFQYYGGETAFYFSLLPMFLLFIALGLFRKKEKAMVHPVNT